MIMKRYFKKSEILREMGKNPKDIRLLDRMIARGEIIEDSGRYRFVDDSIVDNPVEVHNDPVGSDDNKELLEKIERLKTDNHLIMEDNLRLTREKVELEEKVNNSLVNPVDYEELKVNYEYLEDKFQRMKRGYELVLEQTYRFVSRFTRVEKSEYMEQLNDEVHRIVEEEFGKEQ